MARLENLLGAQALALADRLRDEAGRSAGAGVAGSDCAALVTMLAHPGQTVGWLGDVLGLTSSGATRLVERLIGSGHVEGRVGDDARRRQLTLTPAGTERAELVLSARSAALSRALAGLSRSERAQLERLLAKVIGGLAEDRMAALRVCRLCDRTACSGADRDCPLRHTVPDE